MAIVSPLINVATSPSVHKSDNQILSPRAQLFSSRDQVGSSPWSHYSRLSSFLRTCLSTAGEEESISSQLLMFWSTTHCLHLPITILTTACRSSWSWKRDQEHWRKVTGGEKCWKMNERYWGVTFGEQIYRLRMISINGEMGEVKRTWMNCIEMVKRVENILLILALNRTASGPHYIRKKAPLLIISR